MICEGGVIEITEAFPKEGVCIAPSCRLASYETECNLVQGWWLVGSRSPPGAKVLVWMFFGLLSRRINKMSTKDEEMTRNQVL